MIRHIKICLAKVATREEPNTYQAYSIWATKQYSSRTVNHTGLTQGLMESQQGCNIRARLVHTKANEAAVASLLAISSTQSPDFNFDLLESIKRTLFI